nr:hypothetical protein [uncultured Psychroserpens sp.]
MKQFLLVLALIQTMNSNMKYENLLGEQLFAAESIFNCTFRNLKLEFKNFEGIMYGCKDYNQQNYLGTSIRYVSIKTNQNQKIQSVSIKFYEAFNRHFFDLFVEKYGEPDSILIPDNIKIINDKNENDSTSSMFQKVRATEFDLREGTFEEKPLYIIWEKESYQIKAFLRHRQNMSEITFNLKEPN